MSLVARFRRVAASLRLLWARPPDERRMVFQAWTDLLACRLQARFPRAPGPKLFEEAGPRQTAASVDRLVAVFNEAAATCAQGAPCLPRSLALRRFLERYGANVHLRLGMKKTDAGWAGHAWLERDDRVVGDSEEFVRQFVPFRETA